MGPGLAIIGAVAALSGAAPAACPAGVPTQQVTVVNQAHVRPSALAKVESAVTAQSMQLRAAWGTPCVSWAPAGWPLYLQVHPVQTAHFIDLTTGVPWAVVGTGGLVYQAWSSSFSHEMIEMLVDPSTTRSYTHNPEEGNLEIADPVEHRAYRLGGTWVSDFVLPAWYAGGTDGVCATVVTPSADGWLDSVQCDGSLIASADAPGPYDQMGVLSSAWQLG